MTKTRIHFAVIFFLACLQSYAQDSLKIATLAKSFLEETKLPGLSIAVSKNDTLIYAKGFGFANVEEHRAMSPTTRIRTASVAKVLTATALGRLANEGHLDFDAPIQRYVPYIRPIYAALTVRQLAGHTSGLTHRPSGNGYQNRQFNTIKETLEIIDAPLLFPPGTDYQYSTNAFNILAAVIEGASGLPYAEYMKKQIFDPLGMHQTTPEDIRKLTANDADIYFLKNERLKRDRVTNGSYKVPGAAFRSTASDLVRLMGAYSPKGFISDEVMKDMFTSNVLTNGEKTHVGIAWRSSIDVFGHQVIEHAGNWRGARTVLVHYPKEQLSIALMVNAQCQILIEETAHIFAQLFRNPVNNTPTVDTNAEIILTHNSKEGPRVYDGTLRLENGQGRMRAESNDFLKSNAVIQFNSGFVLSTFYGLLYMDIEDQPTLSGKVYAYSNRNSVNPKEKEPLVTVSGLR